MLSGRIPDILPEHFPDLSGYSVFIAGTPEFVESCRQVVKGLGAQDSLIHTERYFPQHPPETPAANRLTLVDALNRAGQP